MSDLEHAPNGYHFARVLVPGIHREYLLPIADMDMTADDWARYEELQSLAETQGTCVSCGNFRTRC